MAQTGHRLVHAGGRTRHEAGICTDCREELGVQTEDTDRVRVDAWGTGKYADLLCIGCGMNLSSKATPMRDASAGLDALCELLNRAEALDVHASYQANKQETTVHATDSDGNPIAKTVRPASDADNLVMVLVKRRNADGEVVPTDSDEPGDAEEMRSRANRVAEILDTAGLTLVGDGGAPADLDNPEGDWWVYAKDGN